MKIINTTDTNKCNCVLWLRDRLPELPYGLWTLDDKKNIINSNKPVVGSGAMSSDGVWFNHEGKRVYSGHVAYVTKVDGDKITIREANYKSCTITERVGTMSELNLIGFFAPNRILLEEEDMGEMDNFKEAIEESSEIMNFNYYSRFDDKDVDNYVKKIKKLKETSVVNCEEVEQQLKEEREYSKGLQVQLDIAVNERDAEKEKLKQIKEIVC